MRKKAKQFQPPGLPASTWTHRSSSTGGCWISSRPAFWRAISWCRSLYWRNCAISPTAGDSLRRARGRRGLDVLAKLQKELKTPIIVDETDYPDLEEVDVKLLRLCRDNGGTVVTNDYNLNKVAGVTGLRVLNINDLANALKPMLMAGEELTVQIVREGKEPGQGVAYLDDGTMIVVENGRRYVGETVTAVVTTVLQTSAGRMIFTRLKPADEKAG